MKQITSGSGTGGASTVSVSYRPNGEVETITDGEGNRTSYAYDGHDRLRRIYFPGAARGADASSTADFEEFGYDAARNITTRRLRDGMTIAFDYDALNRLVRKDLPGVEPDVTYTYDLLGRLTGASQAGHAMTLTYDSVGRSVTQGGPLGSTTVTYDEAGRRSRLTYPGGGLYLDYDYSDAGDLLAIRENGGPSGAAVLARFGYDDLGRRTNLTRGNGTVTIYRYDAVSRLSELTQDLASGVSDVTFGYIRNAAGQIASANRSNDAYAFSDLPAQASSDTHNGLNQIISSAGSAFVHDPRGNTIEIGSATYAYSVENLMASGRGATLSYDPMMRLSAISGSSGTTRFLYDGPDLIAEMDGSSNVLRRFVHGPGTDEPLVQYEGAGTTDRRYLHADGKGSIIAVSDNNGAMVGTPNRYDEFGRIQGSLTGRFGYTGQSWIPELGLWNYKARLYNPLAGRFMQRDPLGHLAGPNPYAFAEGDPLNLADPDGLQADIVEDQGETITVTAERYRHDAVPPAAFRTPMFAARGDRSWRPGWGIPGGPISEPQAACRSCHGIETTQEDRYTTEAENEQLIEVVGHLIPAAKPGRVLTVSRGLARWLGPNFTSRRDRMGNWQFESADGKRRFRVDFKQHRGRFQGPHAQFEVRQYKNRPYEPLNGVPQHIYFRK